jgi:hypothetical protein
MYREAIHDADSAIRDFAVDSLLLRASISHASEWADFEKQLEPADEYVRCISWIGRTVVSLEGTSKKLGAADNEERRKTILWLIENHPETRIHQHVEARLDCPGDEAAYDTGRSLWLKKLMESPLNVDILSNAAYFLARREPPLSRYLISACTRLQPEVQKWHRQLAALDVACGAGQRSDDTP